MYLEKRKSRKNVKYYLVHSYRDGEKVEKIRRYLGSNLSKKELENKKSKSEKIILDLIKEINTDVFFFTLTKKQVESLNKYNDKIKVINLSKKEWIDFTEDFVYNTNAIEGSTVSEDEVSEILNKKKVKTEEEIETKGVANAVDYIRKTKEDLSLNLMLKLHELCFKGSKSFAGKFRDVNVVIKNFQGEIIHSGVPKNELNKYLEDFVKWYKDNKNNFKPLVLAAILHNQFEYIHPFQDGNGRVGRLLLNFILIKNNYPPINIMLENRQEYYHTLQEYQKRDNLKPTLEFLIKQYKKTLKEVTTKTKEN
ncbi:Fic family protein [Candidatus Pacearchaeota archaeon CG10_big_fil_rev_8_21_14_0_10_34_12]|nr:MAG: Fic family protein [Candidatus Pacearchaeota archaeon CG10_big_fil_rev_8_21_14_0_10_34_12]